MRLLLLLYAWIPSILSIESMTKSKEVLSDDSSFRNLISVCGDGKKPFIHYFEVNVFIQPDTFQICPIADQIKLGLDIDFVLATANIGETGVDENVIVAAKVCPKPVTSSARRELLLRTSFVFNGGGGCRGCISDNLDARRNLQLFTFGTSEWFENVYALLLEIRLQNAIQFLVVPRNLRCLGLLPRIRVEIHKVTLSELASRFECQLGSLTPVLTSMSLNSVITPDRECRTCHNVNFTSTSDGIILRNGKDIHQEWKSIGLIVNATATSATSQAPLKVRIFDTSNSSCIQATNTQEFGSPNKLCPGGGPGVGNGGAPGSDGENCNSVGNVLIIQDPSTSSQCPIPNANGGKIVFQFDSPVYFLDIGLLDADETQARLIITYADNVEEMYKFTTFGDNSVQRVIVSKNNVIKFEVLFVTGSGAVTDINFCTLCNLEVTVNTNQGCIIAGNTVTNTLHLIEWNDFEGDNTENSLQGWTYGTLNSNEPTNFTKFLGLYNQSNDTPHKTFSVPKNASAIFFDLDFYMIDNWSVNEEIWIFVDNERIPIEMSVSLNPVQQTGNTSLGILWTSSPYGKRMNIGFLPYLDQKYHITIEIPASTQLYNDGNVHLLLRVGNTTTAAKDRYAGWDNIKVSARYNCEEVMPSTSSPTVAVTPKPSSSVMTITTGPPDPSKFPTSTPTLITPTPIALTQLPTTISPTSIPISSPPTKNPTSQPVTLLQALWGSVTATPTNTKPPTIAPTTRLPTTKSTAPPTLLATPRPTSPPTTAKPTTSLLGILSFGILKSPTVKPVASPSPTKVPTIKVA